MSNFNLQRSLSNVFFFLQTKKLDGNDRFEGFAIDLMTEIAAFLKFNVTFKLVDDGNYGSQDEHGNWNGMIEEVMKGTEEGGADFAVGKFLEVP